MRMLACAAAVLTITAACRDHQRPPPAPVPASDAGTGAAVAAAVPITAAAPSPAEAVDAAVASDRAIPARFAVARYAGDQPAPVVVYEIVGGALRAVAQTPVADVRHLAWSDAAAPLYVAHGRGAEAGAGKVGEIRAGRYRALAPSGRGDIVGLTVGGAGDVWVDRCVRWGDNLEEEGCLRHLHVELPPGQRTAATAPAAPGLPAATPAPAGVALTTRPRKVHGRERYLLDCDDGAAHALVAAGDEAAVPPTWIWLSAAPPIALVEISYADTGERFERRETRLVRGCALGADAAVVQRGRDGLWAEREDQHWTVYALGTILGQVEGLALVFAGGPPYGGLGD